MALERVRLTVIGSSPFPFFHPVSRTHAGSTRPMAWRWLLFGLTAGILWTFFFFLFDVDFTTDWTPFFMCIREAQGSDDDETGMDIPNGVGWKWVGSRIE